MLIKFNSHNPDECDNPRCPECRLMWKIQEVGAFYKTLIQQAIQEYGVDGLSDVIDEIFLEFGLDCVDVGYRKCLKDDITEKMDRLEE